MATLAEETAFMISEISQLLIESFLGLRYTIHSNYCIAFYCELSLVYKVLEFETEEEGSVKNLTLFM